MQNAYSQQASFEIEQQIGERGTLSVGYQNLRGLHLIISVNQNVPTCVASGNNNGCRPNPNYANNSRYSSLADSNYNAMHVAYLQRPVRWGSYRVSYTYSKSLNNVGEFFFSSPINHYNIWQDYGRSDDDQRHRFVFNGTAQTSIRSRQERLGTPQPRLSVQHHGSVLFGPALQHHDRDDHHPRHQCPTDRERSIHQPQRRHGLRLCQPECAAQPHLPTHGESAPGRNRRRVQPIESRQRRHAKWHVRHGAYPTNPSPTFGQTTSVGDPRTLQLALRFLF